MNAGQYLVSKSPLSSGTALAHLLAMKTGGDGLGTMFVSMFAVCAEAPTLTLTQRPTKRAAIEPVRRDEVATTCEDALAVLLRSGDARVLTSADALTVSDNCRRPAVTVRYETGRLTVNDTDFQEMN